MRRFQEAGRSTSSTPEGAACTPLPSASPKHPHKGLQIRPNKTQKNPSADYRRQEIRRGMRYKESRPAGGRKVAQEEER